MSSVYDIFLKAHTLISNENMSKEDIAYISNALSLAINAPDQVMDIGEKSYHDALVRMVYDEREKNAELKNEIADLNRKIERRSIDQQSISNYHAVKRERDVLFWVLRKQMEDE